MFNLIYKGPHGDTVAVDKPKLEAYKQMGLIKNLGRNYTLVCNIDGSYTVNGDGLAPITFEKYREDSV